MLKRSRATWRWRALSGTLCDSGRRLALVVTRYVRLPCLEGDPGSTPGKSILKTGDSEDTEIASKSRNFEAFSRHLALARPIRERLG